MATYQCPDVSIDEAVQFFNSDSNLQQIVGSQFGAIDFRKPDPQKWVLIYGGMFELLTAVPYGRIRQDVHHVGMMNAQIEHPEICEDATHLCLLALYMRRLLSSCGVQDFEMKDLIKPTTSRLLKVVSALLNFYKFRTTRMDVFNELKEKRERENEHHVQLLKANDELRKKINNIKAVQAEKEPHIAQLQDDIREMNNKMAENYRVQTGIQKSISEVKTKIAGKKASNDQVRVQIVESKKLCEKLSKQIVPSPERVKEEKSRTDSHLTHLKQTLQERMQRVLELRQQIERLRDLEDECEQAQKMLKDIVIEDEKKKECVAEIAKVQEQIQSTNETIRKLCSEDQKLEEMIAMKQEKTSKLTLQHQHRMAGAKESLQQLQQQVEMKEKQHSEVKDEVRDLQKQKRMIVESMDSEREVHELNMQKMRTVYSKSLEKLEAYHAKLVKVWENA